MAGKINAQTGIQHTTLHSPKRKKQKESRMNQWVEVSLEVNQSKNPGSIGDSPALLSPRDRLTYLSSPTTQRSESNQL